MDVMVYADIMYVQLAVLSKTGINLKCPVKEAYHHLYFSKDQREEIRTRK